MTVWFHFTHATHMRQDKSPRVGSRTLKMEKEEGSSKLMATTSSIPRFVWLFRVCRAHLEARRLVGCAREPVPSSKGSETFTTHRVATFATHVFCPEFRVTMHKNGCTHNAPTTEHPQCPGSHRTRGAVVQFLPCSPWRTRSTHGDLVLSSFVPPRLLAFCTRGNNQHLMT